MRKEKESKVSNLPKLNQNFQNVFQIKVYNFISRVNCIWTNFHTKFIYIEVKAIVNAKFKHR